MDKEKVVKYVMTTPYNTNEAILRNLLDDSGDNTMNNNYREGTYVPYPYVYLIEGSGEEIANKATWITTSSYSESTGKTSYFAAIHLKDLTPGLYFNTDVRYVTCRHGYSNGGTGLLTNEVKPLSEEYTDVTGRTVRCSQVIPMGAFGAEFTFFSEGGKTYIVILILPGPTFDNPEEAITTAKAAMASSEWISMGISATDFGKGL